MKFLKQYLTIVNTIVILCVVGVMFSNNDIINRNNAKIEKEFTSIRDSLYHQEAKRLVNTCVYNELRGETIKLVQVLEDKYELHSQWVLCERDECVVDMRYSTIWGHKNAVTELLAMGDKTLCLK